MSNYFFTSESVSEGHPDKMCDQISDAVLDECLRQDKMSRVACETAVGTGFAMVFGEITTSANLDYEKIIKDTIKKIGYTNVFNLVGFQDILDQGAEIELLNN